MKQFYSCIDSMLTSPQPEQHALCRSKAMKEGGEIVFYGAEEYRVAKQQPFILGKLLRTGGLDGVVFFSFDQFCYGDRFNLLLLQNILTAHLSVHFAREDISILDSTELSAQFMLFSAYFHALRRRRTITADEIRAVCGSMADS